MRKKLMWITLVIFSLIFLTCIYAMMPRMAKMPEDLQLKEVFVDGKQYVIIDGSYVKTNSLCSIIASDVIRPEIRIRFMLIIWNPAFLTLSNNLPILLDKDKYYPGEYTIVAYGLGEEKTLGTIVVENGLDIR